MNFINYRQEFESKHKIKVIFDLIRQEFQHLLIVGHFFCAKTLGSEAKESPRLPKPPVLPVLYSAHLAAKQRAPA